MKTTRIIFIILFALLLVVLGYDFLFPRVELASSSISNPNGTPILDPSVESGVISQFRMALIPFIALSSACLLSWLFLRRRAVSIGFTIIGFGLAFYITYFSYQNLLGYTSEQKLTALFSGRGLLDLAWILTYFVSLLVACAASCRQRNSQQGEQIGEGEAVEAA